MAASIKHRKMLTTSTLRLNFIVQFKSGQWAPFGRPRFSLLLGEVHCHLELGENPYPGVEFLLFDVINKVSIPLHDFVKPWAAPAYPALNSVS